MRLGNRKAARGLLNDLLADIFLFSGGNTSTICARVYELTGFLFRAASEAGASGDKLLGIVRESQVILNPDIGFEELCYATTQQMENFIDAICESRPDIPGSRYLMEATAYLDEHYAEGSAVTLSSVASALGLSPSYLSHLFSGGLKITFTEYLARLRTDAAKELLRNTLYSVSEIAGMVGFEDPNYFIRLFKKTVGITPVAYRKICAGEGRRAGKMI